MLENWMNRTKSKLGLLNFQSMCQYGSEQIQIQVNKKIPKQIIF